MLSTTYLSTPLLAGPLGGGLGDLGPGETFLLVMFALAGLCLTLSVLLALFLVLYGALVGVISLFKALFSRLSRSSEPQTLTLDEIRSGAVPDHR